MRCRLLGSRLADDWPMIPPRHILFLDGSSPRPLRPMTPGGRSEGARRRSNVGEGPLPFCRSPNGGCIDGMRWHPHAIKDDRHFSAINVFLIEDPIFEDEIGMRILGLAKIVITNMELRLRSMGIYHLDPSPPILLGYAKHLVVKINTLFNKSDASK